MDDADFRILAHLYRSPFATDAEVARSVGLTRPAVSARLDHLQGDRVLGGFITLPAAALFGRRSLLFPFREATWRSDDLEAILEVDPVVWVSLKHDGAVTVNAYLAEDEAGAPRRLLDVLSGPPLGTYESSLPTPRVDRPVPSSLDWRILIAILSNPRGSIAALANATGLTQKTVRRRRGTMVRDGLLAVVPVVECPSTRGVLLFNLAVYGATRRMRSKILEVLPRAVVLNEAEETPMLYLLCQAESLGEVLEAERRVRGVSGVRDVHLTLHKRWGFARDRLEVWAREELARWETRGRDRHGEDGVASRRT